MKIACVTYTEGNLAYNAGKTLGFSFKRFHPDIPFIHFTDKDEHTIMQNTSQQYFPQLVRPDFRHLLKDQNFKNKNLECYRLLKLFDGYRISWIKINRRQECLRHLLEDKNFDLEMMIDADAVVLSRLDEFLTEDYDIGGTLAREYPQGDPREWGGFKDKPHLNAGVTAFKNSKAAADWRNILYDTKFRIKNNLFKDNKIFNYIAYYRKHNLKIVDKDSYYYNTASNKHWKKAIVKNNKLWVNNKHIKILHWGGGHSKFKIENRTTLPLQRFNKKTKEFLKNFLAEINSK